MKKFIAMLLVATVLLSASFAIDFSMGLDVDYAHSWWINKTTEKDGDYTRNSYGQNHFSWNVFADLTYVQFGIGTSFSEGIISTKTKTLNSGTSNTTKSKTSEAVQQYLNLKLLAKYPISLGIATVYPTAGFLFSNRINDMYMGSGDGPKNAYYFLMGFGADITMSDKLYLKVAPCFGIQMNKTSKYTKTKKSQKKIGGKYLEQGLMLDLGLGIGYRF